MFDGPSQVVQPCCLTSPAAANSNENGMWFVAENKLQHLVGSAHALRLDITLSLTQIRC